MRRDTKYILLFSFCFIGVAVMYIGGLVSDHKRDTEKREHEEATISEETKTDSMTVSTNSIPSKTVPVISNTNVDENIKSTSESQKKNSESVKPSGDKETESITGNPTIGSKSEISIQKTKTDESMISNTQKTSSNPNTKKNVESQQNKTPKSIGGSSRASTGNATSDIISDKVKSDKSKNNTENVQDVSKPDDEKDSATTDEVKNKELPAEDDIEITDDNENETPVIDAPTTEEPEEDIIPVDDEEPKDEDKPESGQDEPEDPVLTTLEKAEALAAIGNLDSFLELTQMVENSENTLEQRQLIQIAGTMSDTLAPEILFEMIKVSTSADMLKMAVVTLSESSTPEVINMAVQNYANAKDKVEQDYLLDVIVKSSDPAVVPSLINIASENAYNTQICKAAINTMAIIGTKESTNDLLGRFSTTSKSSDVDILTKSVSKIHSSEALPILIENVSGENNSVETTVAIVKALGNYPAKDVSATLDQLYNQPNLNSSIKYEIDKTYEKIAK
ncbi:MAG: hypothetical protein PF692_07000 [Kiritimatiellae bacterium]|jgi:hypothetical protein|nr:hypothetical protein [Kiritimatiellia bacterium]